MRHRRLKGHLWNNAQSHVIYKSQGVSLPIRIKIYIWKNKMLR